MYLDWKMKEELIASWCGQVREEIQGMKLLLEQLHLLKGAQERVMVLMGGEQRLRGGHMLTYRTLKTERR